MQIQYLTKRIYQSEQTKTASSQRFIIFTKIKCYERNFMGRISFWTYT
jgi:hypothetical protein